MVVYSHLSMIPFVILAMSMVRLLINYSSLLAKNYNDDENDDDSDDGGVEVVTYDSDSDDDN